jgi:hypothetical protein
MQVTGEQHGEKAQSLGKVGGMPSLERGWCYDHGLPVTSYGLTLLTEQLLYKNTPDFALEAPLCLLLATFQFLLASEGP